MFSKTIQDEAWWLASVDAMFTSLGASDQGLDDAEAGRRLKQYGRNVFRETARQHFLLELAKRFQNPLILLLLVAGAVSAFTGEMVSALLIGAIVLVSVSLDYLQEHRAEQTAERLRQSVALRATVIRQGKEREIPADMLVPGDVVCLSAGNLIPADGLVMEAKDLYVKQAALTGEAFPVEKHAGVLPHDKTLDAATNALFMGSSLISGQAKMLVCKTGEQTQIGGVAQIIAVHGESTAFEMGIRHFGYLILRVTILLVLFVLMVNGLVHRPLLESFLFSLALAVGLTPELLPMVVTVTLSRGALRLAEQKVIVKRLSSLQNLGAMDVLCTDKTGTLTEAKISLAQHVNIYGQDNEPCLSGWLPIKLLDASIFRCRAFHT